MDLGSAIVGAILLAICIVPIVIMHYNQEKKENKRLLALDEIARQHDCKISQHEKCGDFAIGMDESRNFVFFFKQKKAEEISRFVNLSEIQSCQVANKSRIVKNGNEKISIIESLGLAFIPINKTKAETRFELYNDEINNQFNGELELVDKWSKKINRLLKIN